jgi:hypothetical protein
VLHAKPYFVHQERRMGRTVSVSVRAEDPKRLVRNPNRTRVVKLFPATPETYHTVMAQAALFCERLNDETALRNELRGAPGQPTGPHPTRKE